MPPISLRFYPDPILDEPCQPVAEVTDEIQALAKDMVDLMIAEDGVGLAAPQVGRAIRLFVVDIWWPESGNAKRALTFINPSLTFSKARQRGLEGCLSLPGIRELVTRSDAVHVEATGLDGLPFSLDATGFLAVAIQHEHDHLEGVTMLDRMGPTARRMALKALR